jgi:hypothetical protein
VSVTFGRKQHKLKCKNDHSFHTKYFPPHQCSPTFMTCFHQTRTTNVKISNTDMKDILHDCVLINIPRFISHTWSIHKERRLVNKNTRSSYTNQLQKKS